MRQASSIAAASMHMHYMPPFIDPHAFSFRDRDALGRDDPRGRHEREASPARGSERSRRGKEGSSPDRRSERNDRDRDSRRDRDRDDRRVRREDRVLSECVEMKGIPFSASDTDVKNFFEVAYCSPVRIHRRVNGGEAYVEFQSKQEAAKAMTRNKACIGRRYIDLTSVLYEDMARTVGLPMRRDAGFGWGF